MHCLCDYEAAIVGYMCQSCEDSGHQGPWTAGGCGECNKKLTAKMLEVIDHHEPTARHGCCLANFCIVSLQERVDKLEKRLVELTRQVDYGSPRVS